METGDILFTNPNIQHPQNGKGLEVEWTNLPPTTPEAAVLTDSIIIEAVPREDPSKNS